MQSHGSTGTKATIGARNHHCWSSQGWGSTCQSYCQRPLPHGKVQPNLLFFFSILGYLFTLTTIMNKMKNIHSGHLHSCKLLLVILFVYISISRAHIFHVVSMMNNSQNSGWAWSWRVSTNFVLTNLIYIEMKLCQENNEELIYILRHVWTTMKTPRYVWRSLGDSQSHLLCWQSVLLPKTLS